MSVLLAFAYFSISPMSSYFIFLYLNRERMVLVFASTLAMRVPLCLSPSIKQLWNFFSDLQLSTLPSALLLMPRGHLAGLKDDLLLLLLFFLWIIGRRTHFLNNTKKKYSLVKCKITGQATWSLLFTMHLTYTRCFNKYILNISVS